MDTDITNNNLNKFITFCLVPGEPKKVKLEPLNSTAISIQWRPPTEKDQNGIIRGYQVYYVHVNDRDEPLGSAAMFDVSDPTKTEAVVAGLQPDTSYQFQIAAYTRKGDGERTKPRNAKTKGAGEGRYLSFVNKSY